MIINPEQRADLWQKEWRGPKAIIQTICSHVINYLSVALPFWYSKNLMSDKSRDVRGARYLCWSIFQAFSLNTVGASAEAVGCGRRMRGPGRRKKFGTPSQASVPHSGGKRKKCKCEPLGYLNHSLLAVRQMIS